MEQYQSISIMKAKKEGKDCWIIILAGNIEDRADQTALLQKEFANFNEVKEYINSLSL